MIEPALRWPGLTLLETAVELAMAAAPADRSIRRRECARAFGHFATRPPRPGRRPTSSACWPSGQVDPRLWGGDEFKAHADLCIHCKLCRTECPSEVDVSSLMLEAKAAHVDKHGLPTSDWIFSRIELWARLGSRFPIVTNFLLTRQFTRFLLDRLLGISRHRLLPRCAAHVVYSPGAHGSV